MKGTHFWNLQSNKLSQLSPGPEGFLVSIALRGYHDAYKQNKNRGQIQHDKITKMQFLQNEDADGYDQSIARNSKIAI